MTAEQLGQYDVNRDAGFSHVRAALYLGGAVLAGAAVVGMVGRIGGAMTNEVTATPGEHKVTGAFMFGTPDICFGGVKVAASGATAELKKTLSIAGHDMELVRVKQELTHGSSVALLCTTGATEADSFTFDPDTGDATVVIPEDFFHTIVFESDPLGREHKTVTKNLLTSIASANIAQLSAMWQAATGQTIPSSIEGLQDFLNNMTDMAALDAAGKVCAPKAYPALKEALVSAIKREVINRTQFADKPATPESIEVVMPRTITTKTQYHYYSSDMLEAYAKNGVTVHAPDATNTQCTVDPKLTVATVNNIQAATSGRSAR